MVLRLDSNTWPTKYRCATVNQEELARLRQIKNIIRMGRVERIESDTIVLTHGSLPTDSGKLHVDCTANGLSRRPALPVFAGNTITLQSLFMATNIRRDKMLRARSEAGLNLVSYCDDENTNDTRDRPADYGVDSRAWQAKL